jgi:hypothetical protein
LATRVFSSLSPVHSNTQRTALQPGIMADPNNLALTLRKINYPIKILDITTKIFV